jgi:hypothetical protein
MSHCELADPRNRASDHPSSSRSVASPHPFRSRRCYQQPPDQRLPGPRDAASPMFFPAGVLAGHKPQIRHQRRRRGKSSKVMQLRQDQHGRQRIDAAETPQPRHRLAIAICLRHLRETLVEFGEPRLELIDRQQIIVDDRALGRVPPRERVDPTTMGTRPVLPCEVQPAPQQQLPRRCRQRCKSSRASSRARARSRTASSSGVGGCTAVRSPARPNSASFRESRRFVFTRSPGFRGISAGATTSQLTSDHRRGGREEPEITAGRLAASRSPEEPRGPHASSSNTGVCGSISNQQTAPPRNMQASM